MDKAKNMRGHANILRSQLLATASGAALVIAVCASQPAIAADADHPIVWIDLGGEFSQLTNSQQTYQPPFTLTTPRLSFITVPPADIEKPATTAWEGSAKLTFEPSGTNWALSAGIIYGRSSRRGDLRQQTAQHTSFGQYKAYRSITAKNDEKHMILDFQAGKDVGLGMLGSRGHSTINIGIRYAQLYSNRAANVLYQPTNNRQTYHNFSGSLDAQRKFTGIGPSLSWDGSARLLGDSGEGISLEWGVNGAVLFGRQHVRGHHQTTEVAVTYFISDSHIQRPVYQHSFPLNRSKQTIVPNLGGFAGLTWRYADAKVSIGYRADFFFGAIDGGVDTRKSENRGFYGPFASISVGLGD